MLNFIRACLALFCLPLLLAQQCDSALASVRLKDMVDVEGLRDNILVGYGIVVGLQGSGDNLKNSVFTAKGLSDFLDRLGVNTRGDVLKTKNTAAVIVTTYINAFARSGSKTSVQISTLGDAKSLEGGTLLATPLLAANGEVYAVAQGPVSIGSSVGKKPVLTAGYVNNGAIIEREMDASVLDRAGVSRHERIKLALHHPDISTAHTVATAINSLTRDLDVAFAMDPGTVVVRIPRQYSGEHVMQFLAQIENLHVEPNLPAKVVVDQATNTVVISKNVQIQEVAIAQGDLVLRVGDRADSLFERIKGPWGRNKEKEEEFSEPGTQLAHLKKTADLEELVQGLNKLSVKTENLVAILKTMQSLGALQAVIEIR